MAEARRQRILLVTRNLPPLVGGMERLNWHMADELSRHVEVRVIGPSGSGGMAPIGIAVDEVPLGPLWKFLLLAQWRAWRVARAWRPDVVLAGSGLTALAVWFSARASGARAAAYVHGLDLAVRHPVYRALWWPVLRRIERVIANSRATAALAQSLGVQPERISIVHPGVDRPVDVTTNASDVIRVRALSRTPPVDKEKDATDFRQQHRLGNRPLLLSVGRLSTRKGLHEFVTLALPHIVTVYPDALLLVVGDAPRNALHAQAQTRESIQAAAAQAGVAENVCFLGMVTDHVLDSVYRAADVHVFPVRDLPDDPEGFGMVAVEAAAHGLPTVAFATGGVVDAVAEGESGCLVASGDYVAFAEAVRLVLPARETLRGPCLAFAAQFAWPRFGERLQKVLGQDDCATGR